MQWTITYYNEKVTNWIDKMPIRMRAYYARVTERIIKMGPNLGMPFTRMLEKDLFELRLKTKEGISRIFYCTVKQRKVVILHGFIKKNQKTPNKELKIARQRMKEVKCNEHT